MKRVVLLLMMLCGICFAQAQGALAQDVFADPLARQEIRRLAGEIAAIRSMIGGDGHEEGAVIVVRDAAAGKPVSLKAYGRTVQDGTPGPEHPVMPVQVDGADGTVQLRPKGKNLIDAAETTLAVGAETERAFYLGTASGVFPGHTYTASVTLTKANVRTGIVTIRAYDAQNRLIRMINQTVPGDGRLALTFTVPDVGIGSVIMTMLYGTEGDTITLTDMQLEHGRAATAYEAYTQTIISCPGMQNAFHGIPVDVGGNYMDENGQQYVCDVLDYTNGVYERHCGYIASYAGEEISGAYMSSTGDLTDGAAVVYALEEAISTAIPAAAMNEYESFVINGPCATINTTYGSWVSMDYAHLEAAEDDAEAKPLPAFDPVHYGMPVLWLEGDIGAMDKEHAAELSYRYKDLTGRASVRWQGSTSVYFPKKNYTVVFDRAFEATEGWGAHDTYCLKANYIDHSHARNICGARLWGQAVKSRAVVPAQLAGLPNAGAVDGFPCAVMLNGEFHGLYTWNIPKGGWMLGMGGGAREAIVCADNDSDEEREQTSFHATVTQPNTSFEVEYCSDVRDSGWILDSLNTLIRACIDSDGSDLDTTIAQYLDWDSAIDSYIFTVLTSGHDNVYRNYLLCTYDGVKWYFTQYDMDETFGLVASGQRFKDACWPDFEMNAANHRVYELIRLYKQDELKARYRQLRDGVMSEANVHGVLAGFVGRIPPAALIADLEAYPTIPGANASNMAQILHFYGLTVDEADRWMEELR